MIAFSLLAFMGVCFFPWLLAAADQAPDIWVVCGQSNAIGRSPLPGPPPDKRVEMLNGKQWVTAQEPLCGGSVGPWHFAALEAANAARIRILNGGCWSGAPIANWDDGKPGIKILTATVKEHHAGAGVFLFDQGQSDGLESTEPATYLAKLHKLAANLRAAAQNPAMPMVIVQIGVWISPKGDFMPIREAERQFVIEDKHSILVPAIGCAVQDNYVHLSTEGNRTLGQRIGRALLKTRYKQAGADWPGPVMDHAVIDPAGTTAFAHFAEVKKLKGATPEMFAAIDAGGVVKCSKVFAENTRIALTLERAVKLPARLVCGYGQNPPATLADEADNPAPAVQLELKAGPAPEDKASAAPNGAGPQKK